MINKFKKAISALLLFMAFSMVPSDLKADGLCCFDNIEAGFDILYWQPCIGDMDYAVHSNPSGTHIRTKYIDPDYDVGYRGWIGMDNVFCGFNGALIYTYFNTDKTASVHTGNDNTIILTTTIPDLTTVVAESRAHAKWKFNYQSFDALLGYPLQVSCDNSLMVEAFSGLTWLNYKQKRHDRLTGDLIGSHTLSAHRKLDFWGIGPVLGLNTEYTLCGCFKAFGSMSTSLIVGESESKDHFQDENPTQFNSHYKSHDDCVCFPGLHLVSGFAYEMCYCDMQIALRFGWEYIHWMNAAGFPYYEQGEFGVRSSTSERGMTLQGIFAGLNVSF